MNVALISLYDVENNAVRIISPLLRNNNHRVIEIYFKHWINNYFSPPKEVELRNLVKLLKDYRVDIAGMSLRASSYHKVAEIITKTIKPEVNIPVVWGGIHPTLLPDRCIETADIVCLGESEEVMVELVNNISQGRSIENIKNLWVKKSENEIIKNEVRPLQENLDSLPFRDYISADKFYIDGSRVIKGEPLFKVKSFRIMVSRGCLYECSFCYNSYFKRFYDGKGVYYRYRGVESVIKELESAKNFFKNLKTVMFDDEIFWFGKDWTEEFLCKYSRRIGLPFECFLSPQVVKEDYITKLKKIGLRVVYMGIQNIERINRQLYNRFTSNEEVLNSARIFHKLGLDSRYQIILDDPVSTSEDKEELFQLLMALQRPFQLYLFSMTVFPRTELGYKLLEKKLINESGLEMQSEKVFKQYRIDLGYPRSKEDVFWISLIVLLSKSFISKRFIYKLSTVSFLKSHPQALRLFAQFCNIIKMLVVVCKMIMRREMSFILIKQWVNLKSLITQ